MVTVEKIIAELKVGGYLDAAEYIERQFATINRTAEFGYVPASPETGRSDARCTLTERWIAFTAEAVSSSAMWGRDTRHAKSG